jgi:hypothetical protein
VSRRIDIQPDDIPEFAHELGIVRQLELAHPVGLKAMAAPDLVRIQCRGINARARARSSEV